MASEYKNADRKEKTMKQRSGSERRNFPFQITGSQEMIDVASRDHETSLISQTTEAEGAWKFAKKL